MVGQASFTMTEGRCRGRLSLQPEEAAVSQGNGGRRVRTGSSPGRIVAGYVCVLGYGGEGGEGRGGAHFNQQSHIV